jgi:hypothetical protein
MALLVFSLYRRRKRQFLVEAPMIACLVSAIDFFHILPSTFSFMGVAVVFYLGFAFFTVTALVFGQAGLLGIYSGILFSKMFYSPLTTFDAFLFPIGIIVGASLPILVFRKFKLGAGLDNGKGLLAYFLTVSIGQQLISSLYILIFSISLGYVSVNNAQALFYSSMVSGFMVSLLIGLPALKIGSFIKSRARMRSRKRR